MMKFESIKKVHEGEFIHRYDISYQTENGKKKVYEMISRDAKIDSLEHLQKKEADLSY